MNTILLIIGLVACLGSSVTLFFKKDFTLLKKLNSIVYTVATGLFLICLNYILEYFKTFFGILNSYMTIVSSVFLISSIIGFIIIMILSFVKSIAVSRIYSILMTVTMIAFLINILYYNPNYSFLSVVVVVLSLLNITMMINSTESLSSKASKVLYFTVNGLNCVFWSACLILFMKKLSSFESLSIILLAIFTVIAFLGTLIGIISLKRNNK